MDLLFSAPWSGLAGRTLTLGCFFVQPSKHLWLPEDTLVGSPGEVPDTEDVVEVRGYHLPEVVGGGEGLCLYPAVSAVVRDACELLNYSLCPGVGFNQWDTPPVRFYSDRNSLEEP